MISKCYLLLLFCFACGCLQAQTTANCSSDFFIKTYSSQDKLLFTYDFALLKDNSSVTCGSIISTTADHTTNALLYKFDATGQKVWQQVFGGKGTSAFSKIITLSDGDLLGGGTQSFMDDISFFLTKLDADGHLLWKQNYQMTLGSLVSIRDLKEDRDGSIYLTCYYIENNLSFNDRVLFIKLDAAGHILYSKSFDPPGYIDVVYPYNTLIDGAYTYIAGHYQSYEHLNGMLMKINNKNGQLAWTKYYDFDNDAATFYQIFKYRDKDLCLIGSDNLNPRDTSILLLCDTAGKVLSSNYFRQADLRPEGRAVIDKEGTITWANYYYRFNAVSSTSFTVARINPLTGVLWSKNYPQLSSFPYTTQLRYGTDSSLYFSGVKGNDFFFGRLSPQGDVGCAPELLNPSFGKGVSTVSTVTFGIKDVVLPVVERAWTTIENSIDVVTSLCQLKNECTFLKLSGPDTICGMKDTLLVAIEKDVNCFSIPVFDYDTSQFKLVGQTAGSARFLVLKGGSGRLKAILNTGCVTLEAALDIMILPAPGPVYLGADRMLCQGNQVVLHAGTGYAAYQWQDGSTDSSFVVTTPGTYQVQVRDGCGHAFADTINVTAASPISFDLGPDRSKCGNDTVTLTAPAGFINYVWSPAAQMTVDTGAQIQVAPNKTTKYQVQAEKIPGCFVYDSLTIFVHYAMPITLGPDAHFCDGDSLELNAGGAFESYAWNTGAATASLWVKEGGAYMVKGIDNNGCASFDTIQVNRRNNPAVQLPEDLVLCAGTDKKLDAGKGGINYQWNNGNTTQIIHVRDTGVYAVEVTDRYGCKARDSIWIRKTVARPSQLLAADTAICSYATLELKPLSSYASYYWNNGNHARTLSVEKAGVYWLEVTDSVGCTWRDSIKVVVKNDCMNGFYVPTAFTPDNNGKNDLFYPYIFGNVTQYRFAVYNRWGETVFQTTAQKKGWDGTYKGKPLDGNVFVWTCSYQLQGEDIKYEKGTVVLIR